MNNTSQSPLPVDKTTEETIKEEPKEIVKEGEIIEEVTVPIITENKLIDFFDALKEVANGKKISRKEWNNDKHYGLLKDEFLMIHKSDGSFNKWIVRDCDMVEKDWMVI